MYLKNRLKVILLLPTFIIIWGHGSDCNVGPGIESAPFGNTNLRQIAMCYLESPRVRMEEVPD